MHPGVVCVKEGAYLFHGKELIYDTPQNASLLQARAANKETAKDGTIAYGILKAHNKSQDDKNMRLRFDAMASHDITYVGIVQTARASGLERFPIPYVLTNCHNSLCAVGGTINEDDHLFGLSAAKKYGGIYVPAHLAVIHTYMREMMSGCGRMILGSDSHTRYGALGTLSIGEGGPELVKQLLEKTYDIARPEVVAVHLTGKPRPGVGPQDVALAIIRASFASGFVQNKVMEFIGEGIASMNVEYRAGIDVMTTETTCLSSIWMTDEKVKDYFTILGRPEAYEKLEPKQAAYYDAVIEVDLDKVECMIALPFHPANAFPINRLNQDAGDILREVEAEGLRQLENPKLDFHLVDKVKNGRLVVDQGVVAGCAGGTYDNLIDVADILRTGGLDDGSFALSLYPGSQPVYYSLVQNGAVAAFMQAGATVRTAFCGPCFGAGDVPANGGLSVRHTTRNFPNREGSKPSGGQVASVALMDARSVAATSIRGGVLTAATELDVTYTKPDFVFNPEIYQRRCYNGFGKPEPEHELVFGPNIADWPAMSNLTEDILLKVVSVIEDAVTTTDELIPSGETSSYRSNPLKLAEFTLSRKDPQYVSRAKALNVAEKARLNGEDPAKALPEMRVVFERAAAAKGAAIDPMTVGIGSVVFANKPGDGSAREQAASCQKVLGGWANIAREYATKRYRSNLINWGMLPFLLPNERNFELGDFLFVPGVRKAIEEGAKTVEGYVLGDTAKPVTLGIPALTEDERKIILAGCLINFYRG